MPRRGDVLMLCGPITHASGMFIQPMLYQGATILLMERFQPAEILEAIEKHRVTMCFFVPAMINALLAEPSIRTRDLTSLRLVSYGAAPMSPARIREAWAAFGPVLAQGYGAGETTGGVIALGIDDHARAIEGGRPELLSACGRPVCESDVQVLDDARPPGRAATRSARSACAAPTSSPATGARPSRPREALGDDGWLHTGDLARVDREGYIYIVDRKKEMLVSGGFNVYPTRGRGRARAARRRSTRSASSACPTTTGARRSRPSSCCAKARRPSAGELMDFCRGRLADFKRPRSVDFVAAAAQERQRQALAQGRARALLARPRAARQLSERPPWTPPPPPPRAQQHRRRALRRLRSRRAISSRRVEAFIRDELQPLAAEHGISYESGAAAPAARSRSGSARATWASTA